MFYLLFLCVFGVGGQTPSSLLRPRHFNYHPYQVRQYLEETSVQPKNGPVVFPTTSPPEVTSRLNNSLPASSLISSIYKPYIYQSFIPDGEKTSDIQQPTLPPLYKALSDHANSNLIKVTRKNDANIHKPKNEDYQYDSSEDEQNQKYAFSYTVKDHKTGDDFSHRQHSSGSATNGEYRVRLPDGRTQIVSYTADENGYKADVRYDTDGQTDNVSYGNNVNNDVDVNYNNNNINANNNNKYDNAIKYNTVDNYNTIDNDHTAIDRYTHNDYKRDEIPIKEEVNEYNDYSSEFNDKSYTPNKYNTETKFVPVRPSYDEIKDLFTKIQVTTPVYDFQVTPTADYQKFDNKFVIIGNRYTDVKSTLANYQNPSTPYFIPDPVTLKPILSQNYINRINKYLTFN